MAAPSVAPTGAIGWTAMAADLLAFLRARLDEDEQIARCPFDKHGGYAEYNDPGHPGHHLRVLAEVDAKRRILDEVVPDVAGLELQIDGEWGVGPSTTDGTDTLLLKILALPYADHPDYQPEWKPSN
jgi:hypothetical protein